MRLCVLRLIQEAKHSALSSINSNPKKKDHFGQKKCCQTSLSQQNIYNIITQQLRVKNLLLTVSIATKKEKKLPLDEKKVHQTLAGMIFCRNFALAIER